MCVPFVKKLWKLILFIGGDKVSSSPLHFVKSVIVPKSLAWAVRIKRITEEFLSIHSPNDLRDVSARNMESLVNNKALLVLYKNAFCYSMQQLFLKWMCKNVSLSLVWRGLGV